MNTELNMIELQSLLTPNQFAVIQEYDREWIKMAIAEKLDREAWLADNSAEAKAIRRLSDPTSKKDWIVLPETTDQEYHSSLQRLKDAGYSVNVPVKN